MIKLKDLLSESIDNSGVFQMYHGGNKWIGSPEINPSKKGRYECGIGIYFTNNYSTARRYAKGGKVVHLVDIDKNFKDITSVNIPLKDMVYFVKNLYGLKKKKEIIQDIINFSTRTSKTVVPAYVLNNLIVNYEVGSGKVGPEIAKYFVSNGIDAALDKQHGDEFWLIVFNPKIIKKTVITNPNNITSYMLPSI